MNKIKQIVNIFVILLLFCLFSCENVQEERSYNVLVTTNNHPYEFINRKGDFDGINIEYIRTILDNNSNINFVTSFDEENKPDIISSFVGSFQDYNLHSQELFSSGVFLLYENGVNFDSINRFFILNQEYLLNIVKSFYPEKNFVLIYDIIDFYNIFQHDKHSVFVFDRFQYQNVQKIFNISDRSTFVIEEQNRLSIDFYLTLQDDNRIFLQTINNSITALHRRNAFQTIFKKFENMERKNLWLDMNNNSLKRVMIIFLTMLLLITIAIYKFKVFSFKSEKLLIAVKEENTELKNKNDILEAQFDNYKSIDTHFLHNLNTLAFSMDTRGNILFINNYSKTLLGYTPDMLIGRNIDFLVSQENKQKLLNLSYIDSQINKSNIRNIHDNSVHSEIEMSSKDGLKRHFIFIINFSRSERNTTQINCILYDMQKINELKNKYQAYESQFTEIFAQRTKQLEETIERVKFVIDKSYNGIFMVQDNMFTLVNDALCVLTGFTKIQFDKKLTFFDILDTEEIDQVSKLIEDNVDQNIGYFIAHTKLKKYIGGVINVEIHFTSVIHENSTVLLGVIHEMAEKAKFEEKKLETEKLDTVFRLTVTLNDQINSPLNAIRGHTEMLEFMNPDPTEQQEKSYKQIYEAVDTIKSRLENLRKQTSLKYKSYNFENISMLDIEE